MVKATTALNGSRRAISRARCLIKGEGVLAGVEAAYRVLELVDPTLTLEKYQRRGQSQAR